ncbi:ABC transporter permease [Candidatus Halobonum tyrrellensis]|uniref:ABC transporter n=1 Tax=Candidatus Halobonum tyrrellensis G22 TaxID=1324957 RepID=V4GQS3_9EURY|nr:ABC transporter permease [Candidatus Halobonum tyrrellensis]ESP87391.1 ABC transporter [Candidatus Halobonum tyrrellensis G22]
MTDAGGGDGASPADGAADAATARPDGGTGSTDGAGFGIYEGEFGAGEVPPEYETESYVEEHRGIADRVIRTLLDDRLALAGGLVVVAFVVIAVFAPYVAPYGPEETFAFMKPPLTSSATGSGEAFHLLGTDSFGHDILTRVVYGARVSLLVALATVAVAFSIGTTIGIVAGFYGGWVDSVLMRYVDFQWAFPEIILGVGIIAVMGGLGVVNVVIAIGIAFIDDFARIIRGEVLSIREEEYVTAARAVGMGDARIMFKEMLPNAVAPLIVQATLMIPLAILAEASLSFLGLGVKPTTPTWGLLISGGRQFISQAPWISVMPGLAIMLVVLGFNTFGDGLRDAFDISQSEVE